MFLFSHHVFQGCQTQIGIYATHPRLWPWKADHVKWILSLYFLCSDSHVTWHRVSFCNFQALSNWNLGALILRIYGRSTWRYLLHQWMITWVSIMGLYCVFALLFSVGQSPGAAEGICRITECVYLSSNLSSIYEWSWESPGNINTLGLIKFFITSCFCCTIFNILSVPHHQYVSCFAYDAGVTLCTLILGIV